jgi:hypothetical protein
MQNRLRDRGLKDVSELAANRSHGDRLRYMAGCRCMLCRAANSRYEVMRSAARKNGDWNGLVSAKRAQKHILKLFRQGVGRRAICAASDVADSIIHQIKLGRKQQIRKRTETRILAVSVEAIADKSLVDAKHTWVLIRRLLDQGFTKQELAKRLGYARAIQFGKERVTARSAAKVERFYRMIME